ncbi:hypothetical protein [Sediminicoccus sp. KRV36]|uniref:hypothetical protein n=1 Tax=Sediminicoccus sp. KRV36 TaxID=3133721 RepID=UPI00200BFACA|nr:hypothetical protein [Sediminicoccus rosea]UPY36472.1 hypothetical protein LHU95_19975 [Sediminicoccus rosea]
MQQRNVTLGLSLVLVTGFILTLRMPAPAPRPAAFCLEIALQAAPGRLVSWAQKGAAALLQCGE